jgi:hypothetical protein
MDNDVEIETIAISRGRFKLTRDNHNNGYILLPKIVFIIYLA